jgi:glycosyltransferase involved in cell wall biosynthesis
MRILCLTYEFPPIGGGGGVVAQALAQTLTKSHGYEIDVVTSHLKGLPEYEESGALTVHRVPCHRIHRHYSNMFELAALMMPLYRRAADLAAYRNYAFNHTHFALPSGLIAYKLWESAGVPYALTLHGSDVPGYNPDRFGLMHVLLRPYWRKIIAGARLIVSPSEFLAGLAAKHTSVPIRVIPNGYDSIADRYPPKRNSILVVTRMFERKGVQFFLEAIKDLRTDWEIIVAGDGPYLPKLKRMARGLQTEVRFTGFIDRRQLQDLYGAARIFVFPSAQENFPVVLLEAMHAGCAIVTTNAAGCAEVVGDSGIQTPKEDSGAIRSALDRLLRNPLEVERYGAKARRRAEEFRWYKIGQRYHDALSNAFFPGRDKTGAGPVRQRKVASKA